jgi:hypothetical protein
MEILQIYVIEISCIILSTDDKSNSTAQSQHKVLRNETGRSRVSVQNVTWVWRSVRSGYSCNSVQ